MHLEFAAWQENRRTRLPTYGRTQTALISDENLPVSTTPPTFAAECYEHIARPSTMSLDPQSPVFLEKRRALTANLFSAPDLLLWTSYAPVTGTQSSLNTVTHSAFCCASPRNNRSVRGPMQTESQSRRKDQGLGQETVALLLTPASVRSIGSITADMADSSRWPPRNLLTTVAVLAGRTSHKHDAPADVRCQLIYFLQIREDALRENEKASRM